MKTRTMTAAVALCAATLSAAQAQMQDASPMQDRPVQGAAEAQPEAPRGLHDAIARGDYAFALKMIEGGADLESRDAAAGASALHFAVMRGRMPVIDLLLSRGANVNSRTRNGTTPLHTAVLYARMEVAELLLENGADINAASASGATPLALAKAARNQPMEKMLLDRGATDTIAGKRLLRH